MLLVILWAISCALLTLHFSVRLERTHRSRFELKRQGEVAILRHEKLFDHVAALRQLGALVLLIITTTLAIAIWNWWGSVIMIATLLVIMMLSRVGFIAGIGYRLYHRIEQHVLALVENYPLVDWFTGARPKTPQDQKIESIEHLEYLIELSGAVLSHDQRTIIEHGLHWHTTTVKSIMVRAKDIHSIKHSELLGPLVLDDLHRSGHDRFPVIRGTIDTIIGMLDISQLLDVSSGKSSETAEKVMSSEVLRIESDETLPGALDMLQKSHLHMLVVVDSEGKTAGIVTLADITASLLGKNRGGVI